MNVLHKQHKTSEYINFSIILFSGCILFAIRVSLCGLLMFFQTFIREKKNKRDEKHPGNE